VWAGLAGYLELYPRSGLGCGDMDREKAVAFVEGYGRTWQAWGYQGFADLFTDERSTSSTPRTRRSSAAINCSTTSVASTKPRA